MRRNAWLNIFPVRKPDPGSARAALGWNGEVLAARYLESRGCRILDRNWRCGGPNSEELDLVAEESGEVVFVEVKTRRGRDFGYPEEAVTAGKRERLRRAARQYLLAKGLSEAGFRIDVIAIGCAEKSGRIALRHIRSAVGETD